MNDIWLTPDGSIHEMPRETTQEERILAATRIVEEAQKTGIRIKDELVEPEQEYVDIDFPGLSRRDYFAGQALAGLAAGSPARLEWYDSVAQQCYRLADAMLKAREQ